VDLIGGAAIMAMVESAAAKADSRGFVLEGYGGAESAARFVGLAPLTTRG
jgi:hypothetical protein